MEPSIIAGLLLVSEITLVPAVICRSLIVVIVSQKKKEIVEVLLLPSYSIVEVRKY